MLTASSRLVCLAALAAALAGCENIKNQLGIGKASPDEFAVVTRAPLTLPPDFNLRPPAPGTSRPQEESSQDMVKAALYNAAPASGDEEATAGELALLERTGAPDASPDIRRIINEENAIYAEDNTSFVDRLMFWRKEEPPGVVVDPKREAQRLQEAEALGKPPTEGETAIIERREKALLEGIF